MRQRLFLVGGNCAFTKFSCYMVCQAYYLFSDNNYVTARLNNRTFSNVTLLAKFFNFIHSSNFLQDLQRQH